MVRARIWDFFERTGKISNKHWDINFFNFSSCSVDVLEFAVLYFPTSLSERRTTGNNLRWTHCRERAFYKSFLKSNTATKEEFSKKTTLYLALQTCFYFLFFTFVDGYLFSSCQVKIESYFMTARGYKDGWKYAAQSAHWFWCQFMF